MRDQELSGKKKVPEVTPAQKQASMHREGAIKRVISGRGGTSAVSKGRDRPSPFRMAASAAPEPKSSCPSSRRGGRQFKGEKARTATTPEKKTTHMDRAVEQSHGRRWGVEDYAKKRRCAKEKN